MPGRHWDFVPGLESRLQSRLSCIQGKLFAVKYTCRELWNKALHFLLVPSMYPSVMVKRIFLGDLVKVFIFYDWILRNGVFVVPWYSWYHGNNRYRGRHWFLRSAVVSWRDVNKSIPDRELMSSQSYRCILVNCVCRRLKGVWVRAERTQRQERQQPPQHGCSSGNPEPRSLSWLRAAW